MILQIKLSLPSCVYLRDPQETKLGISIIQNSIELMDEIGFESFTFKKLATHIDSTEASIYRYFESKNQLLLYLYAWYWAWMHYRVETATEHAEETEEKLITALKILINRSKPNENYPFINEAKLRKIIEYEGIKSILTKRIDEFNNAGAFENYKKLVSLLADWVLTIHPTYLHPNMLITTILEGAHIQHFFAEHLPRLTNTLELEEDKISTDPVEHFFLSMLRNTLNLKKD
jgi:AcrR family transcriptional regulator